jgi:chromate reductase
MSHRPLHVIAIPGSLRGASLNRALLRAARELAPDGLSIELHELHDIPLYNQDLDADDVLPEGVRRFKDAVEAADAVLIATPEYSYGIPGVLKNALDWASRPSFRSPFAGKPVGILGAAPGGSATMRGQEQLKLNLLGMVAQVFPHRGVAVGRARTKFDEERRLVHEPTREFLREYLRGFARWARRVSTPAI